MDKTEFLFSYGTLQLEAVQLATFGRRLSGERDVLPGFAETTVEIEDEATVTLSGKKHHSIVRFTGRASDTIAGTVFALTPEEIQNADKYEVVASPLSSPRAGGPGCTSTRSTRLPAPDPPQEITRLSPYRDGAMLPP